MAVARIPFSGSTHGRGIKVAATATAGTTIHTANNVTTDGLGDFIWLKVYNSDTVNRDITLEVGGTTAPDDNQTHTIPPKTTIWIMEGEILRNSLVLRAFCPTANVLVCFGHVDRVSA